MLYAVLLKFRVKKNKTMEIKFRGQRIDNNEWVYGSLIYREPTPMNEKIYAAIIIFDKGLESTYNAYLELEVKPESVGQLWNPSLRVELYSGDLFTAVCSASGFSKKERRLCKADFGNDGLSVAVWHEKEWWGYGSMDFTSIEIVGNIIDNPELLESVPQHSI